MDTSKTENPQPWSLSPSSGGRRRSSVCNSPEFEFWKVRNPSFPQPNLLSADELFVDGVLLPLHLLPLQNNSGPSASTQRPDTETLISEPPDPVPGSTTEPSPAITDSSVTTSFSASKRWKDIFKKSEKKSEENKSSSEEKGKKKNKEKKKSGNGASSAELNINIWPFSRSRSAGNASTRPKLFTGSPVTRKVNSAPCSRSNSAGESKSRKWPSSPGRSGVHVGRSSPVWQVRRAGSTSKTSDSGVLNTRGSRRETPTSRRNKTSTPTTTTGGVSSKARVLNINVPMCIGYRHNLSCRSDDKIDAGGPAVCGVAENDGTGNAAGSGGNIFNLKSLFTKKSMITSH
ncbi:uncharacterized protein LOC129286708 [Prosopis cineraria]|uniref:uncharacterized protein LOC129286708 n=1 Tax=Prosopis cineraria TaxID=364024 RepID=UPI0024102DE7|nr:uncharacterized protein LOC129286708 [Prosopis cineraria]